INCVSARRLLECFREVDAMLKIFDFSGKMEYSDTVRTLIAEREEARAKNDWILADRIRDRLVDLGIHVHDKKV
ncbi:MAG: hypothetical protein KJ658_18365, partial [Proteobacteria bacterium]|nr:hypothetical protein [Pseudomonadota bacterium]